MIDIFNVNINIAIKFDFFTKFVVHLRVYLRMKYYIVKNEKRTRYVNIILFKCI